MAAIAEKYADRIFVTSDNPRTEDSMAIINDIMQGFSLSGRCKCTVLPSRAEAISAAIRFSNPGSMILIAGKGHEDYQIIKGVTYTPLPILMDVGVIYFVMTFTLSKLLGLLEKRMKQHA